MNDQYHDQPKDQRMDNPDDPDERYARNLPSLLIPYWEPGELFVGDPGDRGDIRPPPGGIVSYLCAGIATLAPYQPGNDLDVTVAVRNWGGGSVGSIAVVRLWWEYPGTSFVKMDPARLMGVASVLLPPRGATVVSDVMHYSFAGLPPPHICLVACVDHPLDPAPRDPAPPHALLPAPGVERHWAQHNLSYVAPGENGMIDFFFQAGNVLERETEFLFEVVPFSRDRLEGLQRVVRAEPVRASVRYEIAAQSKASDAVVPDRSAGAGMVALQARRQTAMHLRMHLAKPLQAGQFSAFELVQRHPNEDRLAGGIALIVTAADGAGR
jgi:hypothetical protein